MRAAVGTHVYGCDICQEVCPYNQPAPRVATIRRGSRARRSTLPDSSALWRAPDAELHRAIIGGADARAKLDGPAPQPRGGDRQQRRRRRRWPRSTRGTPDRPSVADPMVQEHVAWARRGAATTRRHDAALP